ncbi:M4 family metallopeptidase [Macrococcus animalis]|uniref:M4 family metallopeptidase n=1 Tax=Macrococcus animalis TaxID=3395467 RepID=UPI0039BDF240
MSKKALFPFVLTATLATSLVSPQAADASQKDDKLPKFNQVVKQKADLKNVLKDLPGSEKIKKHYKNYGVIDVSTDELGFTHYTLAPKAKGQYATDKEVKVHTNNQGEVVLVNGDTNANAVAPQNDIKITKEDAISNAYKALNINPKEADNMGQDVVKKAVSEIDGDKNKLVYSIELITVAPEIGHWLVKVDAENGDIVKKESLIHEAATTGTGTGVLGDNKTININSISGGYSLEDLTHRGKIAAYNYNNNTGTSALITDTDKNFTNTNQKAGVDANYYAAKVYDYYKNTHNRESYDNNGSPIASLTHVDVYGGQSNMNNAAWVGDKMIYNDGDGRTFTGLSGGKDIVAHEITHGVTQETANLRYYSQSGALNESFSDIFGYFVDNNDWLMGEDVYTPGTPGDALRSISNPTAYGQPDHMNKYVNTASDNAGVHTNSGIPNKAAYNTITKIGQAKAEKIYYRALTQYLTTTSDFKQAKQALYQSALDLYDEATAQDVWNAWNAVGV